MPNQSSPLYFIALLPPEAIQNEVTTYKQHFADNYNSRHALKSPPHVTLQPPFRWDEENLAVLEDVLKSSAGVRMPIPIALSGFGAFPPRVIYVHVEKTPELLAIQSELIQHMEQSLGIRDPKAKSRPFSPHMTIAFKDLKRNHFKAGWKEFQQRRFDRQFTASHLTLLRHNGQRWTIYADYPFNSRVAE